MKTDTCPSPEKLQEMLLGYGSASEMEQLERHFLNCEVCLAKADGLQLNDSVIESIHSVSAGNLPSAEPAIMRALSYIRDHETFCDAIDRTVDERFSESNNQTYDLSFLDPSDDPSELGVIGNFRVLEVIGSGGMGIVLHAKDALLDRDVAIKVIKTGSEDDRTRARFIQEAKSAARIDHPNVIAVHHVGEHRDSLYIVMPKLCGESLDELIQRAAPLDETIVLNIAVQIADGLTAMHDHELWHRDVKPANVFIGRETQNVKVLDLGLARWDKANNEITRSGVVVGTPRFMSPEQACGDSIDHRTDLFSFGAVVYLMISGQYPYDGNGIADTLLAVSKAKHVPLRELIPNANPRLVALVERMLQRDPKQRPQSAIEVSKALAAIRDGHSATSDDRSGVFRKRWLNKYASITTGVLALCVTVIVLCMSLGSGKGTLRLEVPEQEYSTDVKGKEVRIVHLQTGEVTTLSLDLHRTQKLLSEGEYRFLVSSDSELQFSRDTFIIRPRGTETAKVMWRPSSTAPNSEQSLSEVRNPESPTRPREAIAPFNAVAALEHQCEWANHLGIPAQFENSIGMRFQLVPPGEFTMGTRAERGEPGYNSERPHRVRLSQAYYMAEHPLTQQYWSSVMQTMPWKGQEHVFESPDMAASYLSWRDSFSFTKELSISDGLVYRLPTEAEWEWACRAGSQGKYSFGDDPSKVQEYSWNDLDRRNEDLSDDRPQSVGQKLPNAWGLFDVHGNVWEWCNDWYDSDYYNVSPLVDPKGPPTGEKRSQRGGSWSSSDSTVRCGNREYDDDADHNNGVRILLDAASVLKHLARRSNQSPTQMPENRVNIPEQDTPANH